MGPYGEYLSLHFDLRIFCNVSVALLSGVKEALFTYILNLLIHIPKVLSLTRHFLEREEGREIIKESSLVNQVIMYSI